jgi:hypothetical protein
MDRATPTPATDGKYVFVFFPEIGSMAFDFAGKELWPFRWGHSEAPNSPACRGRNCPSHNEIGTAERSQAADEDAIPPHTFRVTEISFWRF